MIALKSPAEIALIRSGGRIVADVLKGLAEQIRPGVSTQELDAWAERYIVTHHAVPAFKGYRGFPATLCTSVNEEVVHGIPGSRVLKAGDIISVDVGVKYQDWHADGAWTYPVGAVSSTAQRLMEATQAALRLAIETAHPGKRVSDIGHAVQTHVEAAGFSVVREFVGHGTGRELHEDPQIPNYGPPEQGARLQPGMVLAVEPMVTAGGYPVRVLDNQWTVVTQDGSLAAHFEHTIAVQDGEAEVLTQ